MRSLGQEETMPCWYYDKKDFRANTPSIKDGIDPDVEARYRKEGARFIMNIGTKMGLRHYETLATGIVYFHRFYMFHSFKHFPRYVTACCCLFLAGKVEETPKKCKDIIKAARSLLTDQQFSQFGEDPKEEVMTLERILLQTIKFDLQVEHPYKYLLKYAKLLKGDKHKLETMVQMAWTFVNDSLFTTLSLQWEPEIIAIALMYLASKLSKFEISEWSGRHARHQRWWDMFVEDISTELLEDVCHQVLDLYSNTASKNESPPLTPNQARNTPPEATHGQTLPAQRKRIITQASPGVILTQASMPVKTGEVQSLEQPIPTLSHRHAGEANPNIPSLALPGQPGLTYKYGHQTGMPSMVETYAQPQYVPSPNSVTYSHAGYSLSDPNSSAIEGNVGSYAQPQQVNLSNVQYMSTYDGQGYSQGYQPVPSAQPGAVPPLQPPPPFTLSQTGPYLPDPAYTNTRGPPTAQYPAGHPHSYSHQPSYSVPGTSSNFNLNSTPPPYHHQQNSRPPPLLGQVPPPPNLAPVRITGRPGVHQNWGI